MLVFVQSFAVFSYRITALRQRVRPSLSSQRVSPHGPHRRTQQFSIPRPAGLTTFTSAGFGPDQFFKGLPGDQDPIGLQRIHFEVHRVDGFLDQVDDYFGLIEQLVEFLYRLFGLLLRGAASGAGLFLFIEQTLPFDNELFHLYSPSTR
jgi:hypothetical protein